MSRQEGVGKTHVLRAFVIIAILLPLVASRDAAYALDRATVAPIIRSADEFMRLAANSHLTGLPPRQSDPRANALLERILDTSPLTARKDKSAPPQANLRFLLQWGQAVVKIMYVYGLAGTNVADPAAVSSNAATEQKIARNIGKFAPELGRIFDTLFRIHAVTIDNMLADLLTMSEKQRQRPDIKNSVEGMRASMVHVIGIVLDLYPTDLVDTEWKRDRLPALTTLAYGVARFGLEAQVDATRRSVLQLADQTSDPTLKERLGVLAAALVPPRIR